ncbi:MAG TPA: histidine phosphatase family protein [Gemmataceae bacterium]
MDTTLYLIRHAATEANLLTPARLQGRRDDPPLAPAGLRQAAAARDLLAAAPFAACYCSPLRRAVETAEVIAAPHRLAPVPVEALTECDVGRWQGRSWEQIAAEEPEAYARHMEDSATFGYPGGETFAEVHERAAAALGEIARRHAGAAVLVVSHHVVLRTYLAAVLGLPVGRARRVRLDNCGVSVVDRGPAAARVRVLNSVFHLGVAPRSAEK